MNKEMQDICNDVGTLADDARALMAATAHVTGEPVEEARKRLSVALESGKEAFGRVGDKAAVGVEMANQTVRENPYQAIGVAFGLGALLGCLVSSRRGGRNGD